MGMNCFLGVYTSVKRVATKSLYVISLKNLKRLEAASVQTTSIKKKKLVHRSKTKKKRLPWPKYTNSIGKSSPGFQANIP